MAKQYIDKDTPLESANDGTLEFQTISKLLVGMMAQTGSEIASANNLSISGSNIFKVTGTVTINKIITSDPDIIPSHVFLILESGITVKHQQLNDTGRISLKGGADLVTSGVTVLHLISYPAYLDGFEWFEVTRTQL